MQCPSTPPRKHIERFPTFGTPPSTKCHKRSPSYMQILPSTPTESPFLSPRSKKRSKDVIDPHNPLSHASVFLPTPLTVGTGRKIKNYSGSSIQPSARSKSLTASLQALSTPHIHAATPTTPPLKIIRQVRPPKLRSYEDSDDEDHVQIVDYSVVDRLPRQKLENPFLGPKISVQAASPAVDYSTHMELINHTTGEKKVQELTEEQRRFKPRRLVFTQDVSPVKVNYNIANKFIGKNMGKSFTMGESQAKSVLGFSIFSDSDEER